MPLSHYRAVETPRPGVQDKLESASVGVHEPMTFSMATASAEQQNVLSALGIRVRPGLNTRIELADNRHIALGPDMYILCLSSEDRVGLFDAEDVVTPFPDVERFALALAVGVPAVVADDQVPGSPAYRAFYGAFLPPSCCWTNGCCRRAKAGEIEALDDTMTRYRVVASGQEIERSAWSPDGAIHVCQCSWDGKDWVKGAATNARCLAVPPPAG